MRGDVRELRGLVPAGQVQRRDRGLRAQGVNSERAGREPDGSWALRRKRKGGIAGSGEDRARTEARARLPEQRRVGLEVLR